MQLFKLIPASLAICLSMLFPARSVHFEPPTVYSTIKLPKSLVMPSVAVYQPISYQSLPVAPQGTYSNTYAFGNCTWYVAGRKQVPESWGNAATWAERAAAQGITVKSVPVVGAIAQRTGGLGHVAIVLAVSGNQVLITEMNSAGFDMVDERWQPISTYNYIYV